MPADFECRATAAMLDSGGSLALAGHVAALMGVLMPGGCVWLRACSILVWCVIVYLALRLKLDSRFFELLASHSPQEFDQWLQSSGLRKNASPTRSMVDRHRGAMRLWRALVITVVVEMSLAVAGIVCPLL